MEDWLLLSTTPPIHRWVLCKRVISDDKFKPPSSMIKYILCCVCFGIADDLRFFFFVTSV